MKHKRKRPGKPGGMNYADVLKSRRDRLQHYGKLKID